MDKKDKTLFLIFNHTMTKEQITDARDSLGITNMVEMPDDLKKIWKQISPLPAEITDLLQPLRQWLKHHAKHSDLVLIQGDFGATWLMVKFALKHGLVPVYATTGREARETVQPDGSVATEHIFMHQRFRRYGC